MFSTERRIFSSVDVGSRFEGIRRALNILVNIVSPVELGNIHGFVNLGGSSSSSSNSPKRISMGLDCHCND